MAPQHRTRPSRSTATEKDYHISQRHVGFNEPVSLWKQVKDVEDANTALAADKVRQKSQIDNLRNDRDELKRKHEIERIKLTKRSAVIMGDYQKKLHEVRTLRIELESTKRRLATTAKQHTDLQVQYRQEQDARELQLTSGEHEAKALREQLAAARLESRVHRCAVQTAFKMLPSLDEQREMRRIVQLCRAVFTQAAASTAQSEDETELQQPQQQEEEVEQMTPARALEPLTPVSMNQRPETKPVDGCAYTTPPRREGLRPRKARVSENGSPSFWKHV